MLTCFPLANFLKAHSAHEKVDNLNKRYAVFQQQFDRGIAIDAGVKTELLLKIHSTCLVDYSHLCIHQTC